MIVSIGLFCTSLVGMVQAGEHLGLSLEPGQPIRICRKRLGQDHSVALAWQALDPFI